MKHRKCAGGFSELKKAYEASQGRRLELGDLKQILGIDEHFYCYRWLSHEVAFEFPDAEEDDVTEETLRSRASKFKQKLVSLS